MKRYLDQIEYFLRAMGAEDVRIEAAGVRFVLMVETRRLAYSIPIRVVTGGANAAWFRLFRYVQAQSWLVEADVFLAHELFLPHLIVDGRTVAEIFSVRAAAAAGGRR